MSTNPDTISEVASEQGVDDFGANAAAFGSQFGPGPSGGRSAGAGNDRSLSTGTHGGNSGNNASPSGGRSAGATGGQGGTAGSGNLGFSRRSGPKRVVGAKSVVAGDWGKPAVKSYSVSSQLQFNDVDEMRPDCISSEFAQDIIETLFFEKWRLDSSNAIVMRKAEDILFSFMVMRTASPYADYELAVTIGGKVVELHELSDILIEREVQRRRFARAISDRLRDYVLEPQNAHMRNILITKLGVFPQYVHLAFDGSTHCSKMNRNEIAFTKSLESSKLFDDESVRGSLSSSSMLDGVFETSGSGSKRRPTTG